MKKAFHHVHAEQHTECHGDEEHEYDDELYSLMKYLEYSSVSLYERLFQHHFEEYLGKLGMSKR